MKDLCHLASRQRVLGGLIDIRASDGVGQHDDQIIRLFDKSRDTLPKLSFRLSGLFFRTATRGRQLCFVLGQFGERVGSRENRLNDQNFVLVEVFFLPEDHPVHGFASQ